jgi:hypothetical protein
MKVYKRSADRMRFSATGRDIHIDQTLSNVAINHRPEGFIADMIAPIVEVPKQSDHYVIFSRADKHRRPSTLRSQGTRPTRVDQNVSSATYFADNYALYSPVTIEERANADPIYLNKIINGRTELITDLLMIDWEVRVANMVNSTTNVGNSASVASEWDGAGDPLGDINSMIDTVQNASAQRPNKVVFGLDAWKSFRRDSNVRNIIFGNNNGGGYPSTQQVKDIFEVDDVLIGGAFQNTGAEGLSESLSTIWTDNVLVYYAPPAPTVERPSYMYSFRWAASGLPNMQAERHPFDSRTKSEDIEVGYYQDERVTASDYAGLITAVNSST